MTRIPKILIADYGMGNIGSVQNAFERLGCSVSCSSDPKALSAADGIVLPGVGAFGEAMANLRSSGLDDAVVGAVRDEGKPVLAICLGMQLLAEESEERGHYKGLGLIPGAVRRIPTGEDLLLPHMGWNGLQFLKPEPIFVDLRSGDSVYFVHSYRFETEEQYVSATTDYGQPITAAVQRDRIFGMQFHPERSQTSGLRIIRNFVRYLDTVDQPKDASC